MITTIKRICSLTVVAASIGAPVQTSVAPDKRPLTYTVSWVGNTYSGKDAWVLQDVEDICVLPDGTLYTNVFWDEAGGNVQEYLGGNLAEVAGHTHGWGYQGGSAVAASNDYVYIVENVENEGGGLKGNSWPAKGFMWSGISRRLRSDIRQAAPFEGGRGEEGDVLKHCFLPLATIPNGQTGAIRGVCTDGNLLFVSNPFESVIQVFDATSMKPVRSWHVDRPDKMCMDGVGNVWVLQRPAGSGVWKALGFAHDGKPLSVNLDFPSRVVPAALCTGPSGRLLIADAGPDQQIKIYEGILNSPKLTTTLGVKGGIFAKPAGVFGDRRFNQPKGVGIDARGNIYVASSGSTAGGSTVLECYSPTGKLIWRQMGLTFVDGAAADPASPDDVYVKDKHFTLISGKQTDLPWTYRGYTVDPYRYPDDPRLHTPGAITWVRTLNGKKILFVTDMTADYLHAYRFQPATDGEIAIPCALFAKRHASNMKQYPPYQPDKGEWLWLDKNGNGAIDGDEYISNNGADSEGILYPDEQGAIWQANRNSIRALPLVGMNEHGVPLWDYGKARTYAKSSDLDEIRRLHYVADKDLMLLGGNFGADHNQHWKPMGPVLCLYRGWSRGEHRLVMKVVLPYEKGSSGHESAEPISFDVAGDYVFVAYTRGIASAGVKNAFVRVLRLSDLSFVGNLSAESALGETGLLDLVESVNASVTASGEYRIFLEDDFKSKVVVFRWRPGA